MADIFKINGETYNVNVIELEETPIINDKYNYTTQNGKDFSKPYGVYASYTVTLGDPTSDVEAIEHNRLFEDLTSINADNDGYCTFESYHNAGKMAFEGRITTSSRKLFIAKTGTLNLWRGLSFTVVSREPYKR